MFTPYQGVRQSLHADDRKGAEFLYPLENGGDEPDGGGPPNPPSCEDKPKNPHCI